MKAWGANRKAQLCGADQSSVPRGLRWQNPSQHPREGSGTKVHDRNQEVGVCPCALQAQKKGTGPSVSPHVDRRANISLSARSCGKR